MWKKYAKVMGILLISLGINATASAWSLPQELQIETYPYPGYEAQDASFSKLTISIADVERLGTGYRWAEGPIYFHDGKFLLFSDLPNDRIMKYDDTTGEITEFDKPSNYTNGMARDLEGRLIRCEHMRQITRIEHDGTLTVLADEYKGKPLNAPNDAVVKSDDSIWFTDLAGSGSNYHHPDASWKAELPSSVYRIDSDGEISLETKEVEGCNGIGFSPDESTLYVTGFYQGKQGIVAFDVTEDGRNIQNPRLFAKVDHGYADGIAIDRQGNIWLGLAGGKEENGVAVYNSNGQRLGMIHMPEGIGNLTFGGSKNNRLFMAGSKSLYALYVETQGTLPQRPASEMKSGVTLR